MQKSNRIITQDILEATMEHRVLIQIIQEP